MSTGLALGSANIKIVLVDTGAYTYSGTHQFLSDVAAGARIATSANLGSKTFTNGVFDAADPAQITGVSGATVEAAIYYIDTAVAGTSNLIYYDDAMTGFVFTPNGGAVNITFHASGIFAL